MYAFNEGRYENIGKSVDVPIFGRNRDIEGLIELYNQNRQLFLSRVSAGMAAKARPPNWLTRAWVVVTKGPC